MKEVKGYLNTKADKYADKVALLNLRVKTLPIYVSIQKIQKRRNGFKLCFYKTIGKKKGMMCVDKKLMICYNTEIPYKKELNEFLEKLGLLTMKGNSRIFKRKALLTEKEFEDLMVKLRGF